MSILLYVYMHVYLIYITMFPSPHALKGEKEKKNLARSDFKFVCLILALMCDVFACWPKIPGRVLPSFFYHSTLLNTWYLVCR